MYSATVISLLGQILYVLNRQQFYIELFKFKDFFYNHLKKSSNKNLKVLTRIFHTLSRISYIFLKKLKSLSFVSLSRLTKL